MKKLFKEHDLAKLVVLMLFIVIALSWIIPDGAYSSGATFTTGDVQRIGLVHIFYGLSYALQNYSVQIIFIIFVGLFYGVLCKSDGYKKLVAKIASFGKNREVGFAVVISFLVAVLTSIMTNSYIMLVFMPFLVHVLRKMDFSRLSTFVTTFGAMLVGVLGATYGTEGALSLITYLGYGGASVTINSMLLVRAGILLLAFILYTLVHVSYLKNTKKKEEVKDEDILYLDEVRNRRAKVWPIAAILVIMFILMVLGFVDWYGNFGIEVFEDFHDWFMGLAIGKFKIFESIVGANLENVGYELVTAFGTWYLFTYTIVLGIATVFVGLFSKIKLNVFLESLGEGLKAVVKPLALMTIAYTVFVFLYWSPFVPTIVNAFGTVFNPFILAIQALIGSIFNTDLGYLGFSLSYYIGSFTGKEGDLVYVIFNTIYGLAMFITPISMFVIFGLSYLKVSYKKWLAYIWKFFVGMLVVLLLIFALLAYL